jgi:hypothetical protein
VRRTRLAVPALAVVLALAAAGCGSDSSGEASAPTVSIPIVTAPTATAPTAPQTPTRPGTTSAKRGNAYNPTLPDSATNDVPPPKGSPQAQFEKECAKHPGTCG